MRLHYPLEFSQYKISSLEEINSVEMKFINSSVYNLPAY